MKCQASLHLQVAALRTQILDILLVQMYMQYEVKLELFYVFLIEYIISLIPVTGAQIQ